MKIFIRFISILLLFVSITNCNQDPCEVDHTIVDGECIPDFIYPPNPNSRTGERFYHRKYGVIIFKKGHWYDKNDYPISELDFKNN